MYSFKIGKLISTRLEWKLNEKKSRKERKFSNRNIILQLQDTWKDEITKVIKIWRFVFITEEENAKICSRFDEKNSILLNQKYPSTQKN